MGTINKVLNLVVALGMGAAAMGRGKKPPKGTKQPKRGPKNKLKRTKQKIKRFTDPKRASKLNRVKNIKKIKADRLARVKKLGNLKKFAKAKQFVGKTTQAVGKNVSKATKAVSKTTQAVGKNVSKATKAVSKTSQAVGKNISKVSGKVSQSAGKIVTRLGMKMNKGMVQSMKGLSKMAKGVKIPIIGPILAAITSYLADGKLDKALFIGIGTALGEMLGSAIPIPVLGTLIGGAIGFYIGDLLYTLFRGGGVKAVVNKLKEDLKKVFNVGKAIFNWSKTGIGRLIEGLPKVGVGKFKAPNPAWLLNPANMVDKAKLIGKAFFSRDPMKEEKDGKKDKEKIDKEFTIGKKKFDLSKLQGGLTNDEYIDLTNKERGILDRRLRMYASQNPKGSANNIVSTNNSISNKASSVSSSASYEEGSDKEIIVVKTKDNPSMTSPPTEEGKVVAVETGGGSGSDATASLYRG
jgi:hypothetical protein